MVKLNIGSGERHLEGYISVDAQEHEGVNVVCNVLEKIPFDDGSVEKIFCSHLIEHFWWEDVQDILKKWFLLLEDQGVLELWTVDFDRVIAGYKENGMEYVNWRMYNRRRDEYDQHQGAFNYDYLRKLLLKAGFAHVERLSVSAFPFHAHQDINMGVKATK